ncbi:hypothetical protein M9Y10_003187 [Tritrichomonas musculus]|uniref:PX domain-containing protein n=1 Tax=Tritrichomonas musculus TaxID=1915356 RepID=A0ABR2JPC4_9EUKA
MMDDTPHVIIPTKIPDIPDGTKISYSQLLLNFRKNEIDQFLNDFCADNRVVNLVDCNSEILENSFVQLQKLISIVNEKMRIEFDSMLEKFNIGQKLTLFLLIKDIIKKSSKDSRVEANDPKNFKFFQINLINCIEVFSNYLENKINIYPNIAQKILKDLEYLCSVFHICRKKD